jgi:hypothetical protein
MDHKPTFQTTLDVFSKLYVGNGPSKKIAEMTAAELAWLDIKPNILSNKAQIISSLVTGSMTLGSPLVTGSMTLGSPLMLPLISHTEEDLININFDLYTKIILVDGENVAIDEQFIEPHVLILIFAAKNTSRKNIKTLSKQYINCLLYLSESVGKDAADHLLTYYAGKLSMIMKFKNITHIENIYVCTMDHYGEFLEKFMDCKFICQFSDYLI